MTAAVSPMPIALQMPDSTAEARKRRREILVSQRTTLSEPVTKPVQTPVVEAQTKRRKLEVVPAKATGKPAKKPQMKYDPDVPMSKEEAAAWRREQRRKRNRESAAASRQRQRDRITELEVELDGWKSKVDAMMDKIKKLEEATGKKAPAFIELPVPTKASEVSAAKYVSPPASPRNSPTHSVVASPVTSSSILEAVQVTPKESQAQSSVGTEQELSDKMVSRQAVKIADTPKLPFLPTSEPAILPPETCSSSAVKLEPIDSSLFQVKEESTLPAVLTDEETEDEFGEFLLDAVQWL